MRMKFASLTIAAALAACGGGGDGGSAAGPSIEGFWTSATSGILVTSTGEMWAVSQDNGGVLTLYTGSVTTSGSNFTSSAVTAYVGAQKLSGSASGTFAPGGALTGTVTATGISATFSETSSTAYAAAPSLAGLAGNYTLSTGGTLTLTAAGAISGAPSGCAVTGTLTPDSSGKNFYRLSVTFGAAPCALPGAAATGVAAPNGSSQLIAGAVSGNVGQAYILTKN